jgi:hypothetical protein
MDAEFGLRVYIIIKGYIDAKDERGNAMFGTILGVVSRRDIKYLSVMFSGDASSKSMKWNDLLFLHRDRSKEGARDPAITHHEEELFKYLQRSTVLNSVAKNRNTKQAEQAISRYCLDSLQLKTVSFIEHVDASENDIAFFEREGGPPTASSTGGMPPDEQEIPAEHGDENVVVEKLAETRNKDDIVVRCEPILDPVKGVAMNELNIGEIVMTKLPEDSVFFKLLSRNISGFDGVVTAAITGILLNELGTATISLALSDGITGVMKLSGKVKVKAASVQDNNNETPGKSLREMPVELVFGIAGILVFIALTAMLFYILM